MLTGVYPGEARLNLHEIVVQPVCSSEERRYQELMRQHHNLGALAKISETVWYVARWQEQWVALLSFSACALKCRARDGWIGWDLRHRYSRLKLIVNNSRFLILPDWHLANLGSRVLGLCEQRVVHDWEGLFGSSRAVDGNLCRCSALSRDCLSGRQLGLCRQHARIPPHSARLQCHAGIAQDGLR